MSRLNLRRTADASRTAVRSALFAAVVALFTGTLSGCGVLFPPQANPQLAARLSQFTYPGEAEMGDDLDIIAVQDSGELRISNQEPRTYKNVQLWLNRRYVAEVDQLIIGPDNNIPLNEFINRHGEPFPSPGLLVPENDYPAVSAELFDSETGQRHRLLTRKAPGLTFIVGTPTE